MKIEKRDITLVALCALGGLLLMLVFVMSWSSDIAGGVFEGLVVGVPSGAGGGVLACIFRRILEKK
jgi:hypothetical protein